MTLAQLTPEQAAALEQDIASGDLSWRALGSKWGLPQTSIRSWAKRRGVLRGAPSHVRAVGDALADDGADDDPVETSARIASRALRRIDVELAAMLAPGNPAALDPRALKTLLEATGLALDIHGRASGWGLPDDLNELTDAEIEALASGKRIRR